MSEETGSVGIGRMVWDLTYACPLRCSHCFTESGRRPSGMLDPARAERVADVIIGARPQRVSIGGGEPMLVSWWAAVASRIEAAGIPVTVFTSGWTMTPELADLAAESVTAVAVSIDGPTEDVHDAIRGRSGSFARALAALHQLSAANRARRERGESTCRIGVEYTVTQSGWAGLDDFVELMTSRFPDLDYICFGAVIPEGLAQETPFVNTELLSDAQVHELSERAPLLAASARNNVSVSVVDALSFLPTGPDVALGDAIAHIEADGQLRASTNFEAKVGNVLDEPLPVLWSRALAWRADPDVARYRDNIRSMREWADATRVLDAQFGSAADQARIARRSSRPVTISPAR